MIENYWLIRIGNQTCCYDKRANKWFSMIEKILNEEGIPDDLIFGSYRKWFTNLRSPRGAKGFWQLMPSTAKEFGLEVNI